MRAIVLLCVLVLAAPVAAAHVDRSSTDPCPPDDIRWWFDHWHRSCCTPSWWCAIVALPPLTRALP